MASAEKGRLVYLTGTETVEIQEHNVPSAGPGSLVTEIVRANVCGSELHIWGGHHPVINEAVLGHEALCRITELGDGVETDYAGQEVSEGDIIAPVYFQTCNKCEYCRIGEFHLCNEVYDHWLQPPEDAPHFHGTFGTHYYIHPNQHFYRVPSDLDHGIAAAANCALSQILFGFDEVGVDRGDTIAIQGAGGLGLNAIAVANELGARSIVVEGVDGRIEKARKFGADEVIDFREYNTAEARAERVRDLTDGLGADVAVEVAGVPSAFSEGVELVRDGGRYLVMGNINPGKTTEFDPGTLTRKGVQIQAAIRYKPWYLLKALNFLEKHANDYPYDELLDSIFALNDVQEALKMSQKREVTRASLTPHDD